MWCCHTCITTPYTKKKKKFNYDRYKINTTYLVKNQQKYNIMVYECIDASIYFGSEKQELHKEVGSKYLGRPQHTNEYNPWPWNHCTSKDVRLFVIVKERLCLAIEPVSSYSLELLSLSPPAMAVRPDMSIPSPALSDSGSSLLLARPIVFRCTFIINQFIKLATSK